MANFQQIANKLASDLQRDFGLTKEQAIGFVGNLAMETAGFKTLQEISPTVSGSRGGYGYAQWTGPRRTQFEAWAKANDLAVDSYAANYGFIKKELASTEKDTLSALKKADTVDQAAKVTMNRYLRPGVPNKSSRLAWAQRVQDGYAYVPPLDIPLSGPAALQAIQDRNAERLGYGEIAPDVGQGRPAYFNETGAPPIPATRPTAKVTPATISPALQSARQRLQLAREAKAGTAATGTTTPAAMAATPRLAQANGQVTGIDDPRAPLDWGQFRPGVGVGGVGSLLDGGINPAALNPAQSTTTVAGRPDAPVGSLPAATTAESKEAQRTTGNIEPVPTPQVRQPAMTTVNGKTVPIGTTVIQGGKLMMVIEDADGEGKLRDVEDIRDDWAKQNLDPNANLLFEDSLAGLAARKIAAPAIKQGLADAASGATKAIGDTANSLVGTATGLYDQAIAKLGSLSKPKASTTGNTLTSTFVSEDHEKSNKPVPYIKPLVPSTTGNTLAKPAAPSMVKTTIANPDYAAWVAKYGDGSQVQTAPTGGMITANQLAAISGSGAPVPVAKPAIPAAPPRTITVMRPGNTLAPTPAAPKVQTAQTVSGKTVNVGQTYQSGGYLYTANANGTFTKIGKVGGSSSSGVLSSLSTSPSKSSTMTRVTTGTNVSGDQNAFSPQSVQSSERWQTGY